MSVDKTSTKRFARVAILTISDTRCFETDTSGSWLQEAVEAEGHELIDRKVVVDDVYQMRAIVSDWVANPNVEVILTTGGTGFTGRDSTPEALAPLFDKHIGVETALLASGVVLVMVVELLNTAIESVVDRVGTEWHELAKRAKDLGSAAVLLSLTLCVAIWAAALYHRISG